MRDMLRVSGADEDSSQHPLRGVPGVIEGFGDKNNFPRKHLNYLSIFRLSVCNSLPWASLSKPVQTTNPFQHVFKDTPI